MEARTPSSQIALESPFLDNEIVPRPDNGEADAGESNDGGDVAGEMEIDAEATQETLATDSDWNVREWELESDEVGDDAEAADDEVVAGAANLWAAEEGLTLETALESEWEDFDERALEGDDLLFEAEAAAETALAKRALIDPDYISDRGEEAPDVWKYSDSIRFLLHRKGSPDEKDRQQLATAVIRQLPTLILHLKTAQALLAGKTEVPTRVMTLYVIAFPGEARDNTGIKDLNDKILGYHLNSQFIRLRQKAISELFWVANDDTFVLVGQDYKTATILTLKATREQFAQRLARLDGRLREILLGLLPEAEKEAAGDKERLARIQALRKALKNEKYKFDIFFGVTALHPQKGGPNVFETVYLLVTQALKGAGLSKVVARGSKVATKPAKQFTKDLRFDDRAADPRGKQYEPKAYLATSTKAGDIKALMSRKPSRDHPEDFYSIYVDTVWTTSFLPYRRWFVGHPDVIRDVRKKALQRPKARQGNVKYWFPAQVEMLELWLVLLNMLDYVKDFLSNEFRDELARYHGLALGAFGDLTRGPNTSIDWARLENVLAKDLRQTKRIAVLGTASEFQFFSLAADYSERIFFAMDIRDFGVALALLYEDATEDIEHHKHTGVKLMEETFKATDPINEQRRFAYDRVVEVFSKHYAWIRRNTPGTLKEDTTKAFGTDIRTRALTDLSQAFQVMMGQDEVFVAAHPFYAGIVHDVIRELAIPAPDGRTLNVRTAVSFSRAEGDPPSRDSVQKSHARAMALADLAPGTLKRLERTHRRIERLIEKLEANPKKKAAAPQYRKELEELGLVRVFARIAHGKATRLTPARFKTIFRLLRAEDLSGAEKTGDVELVNFGGKVVNGGKLEADAAKLEETVRKKVGADNTHVDPPPATRLPKWIEAILKEITKDKKP